MERNSKRERQLEQGSHTARHELSHDADGGEHVIEQRRVRVVDRCDVLVVGGGPAGLSAAIGAARAGADTILVERFGCFGGGEWVAAALRDPISDFCPSQIRQ